MRGFSQTNNQERNLFVPCFLSVAKWCQLDPSLRPNLVGLSVGWCSSSKSLAEVPQKDFSPICSISDMHFSTFTCYCTFFSPCGSRNVFKFFSASHSDIQKTRNVDISCRTPQNNCLLFSGFLSDIRDKKYQNTPKNGKRKKNNFKLFYLFLYAFVREAVKVSPLVNKFTKHAFGYFHEP